MDIYDRAEQWARGAWRGRPGDMARRYWSMISSRLAPIEPLHGFAAAGIVVLSLVAVGLWNHLHQLDYTGTWQGFSGGNISASLVLRDDGGTFSGTLSLGSTTLPVSGDAASDGLHMYPTAQESAYGSFTCNLVTGTNLVCTDQDQRVLTLTKQDASHPL